MKLLLIAIVSTLVKAIVTKREIPNTGSGHNKLSGTGHRNLESFFDKPSKWKELWARDIGQEFDYSKPEFPTSEYPKWLEERMKTQTQKQKKPDAVEEQEQEQEGEADFEVSLPWNEAEKDYLNELESFFEDEQELQEMSDEEAENMSDFDLMSDIGSMSDFGTTGEFGIIDESEADGNQFRGLNAESAITDTVKVESEDLNSILESRLYGLKIALEGCVDRGTLDIGCYAATKNLIREVFIQIQYSKIPEGSAQKVQRMMDDIRRMSEALNKVAIWICAKEETSNDQCMHFSYEDYSNEVRTMNHNAETVLMDVLFSTTYNQTLRADVEGQKTRLSEVQKIETGNWKDKKEYAILEQMKNDISLMLKNSEKVLNERQLRPSIERRADKESHGADNWALIYDDFW